MKEAFNLLSTVLYLITGAICLLMAYKSVTARKYLPFHEKASGKSWESIDRSLQTVIITLLRISGLGFLVVAILLIVLPVLNYSRQETFIKIFVPLIALIFSFGLFLFNYLLYRQTHAKTPWTGSLIAFFIVLLSFVLSII